MSKKESIVIERESGSGTTNLFVHPLVIMNISDHYTREKVKQGTKSNPRVIGILMGVQKGRDIEIFNSFPVPYEEAKGVITLNNQHISESKNLYKQTFPTFDFLGWYSTGNQIPTPSDLLVQKQLEEFNENPLYLLLDPTAATPEARELPISLYEPEVKVIDEKLKSFFATVKYQIATQEAERVAVDFIAKANSSSEDDSMLVGHLSNIQSAIKMLNHRVKYIQKFVESTIKGETPMDHSLLRQIASLCNLLPSIDSSHFNQEFLVEYNDTLLMTYLSALTKGANQMNNLVEKFNIASEGGRRRFMFN